MLPSNLLSIDFETTIIDDSKEKPGFANIYRNYQIGDIGLKTIEVKTDPSGVVYESDKFQSNGSKGFFAKSVTYYIGN